jgi:hypothetical protein
VKSRVARSVRVVFTALFRVRAMRELLDEILFDRVIL